MIKRLVLAATVVAAMGATLAPASADGVCLTTDAVVNGTALPTNGTTCLPPEGTEPPALPPLPELPPAPGL